MTTIQEPTSSPETPFPEIPFGRRIFCNRTLNLKSIQAIGYDMDYTLVHYHVEEWEQRAYEHLKSQFIAQGWPLKGLHFDPQRACRGLIIDTERGNLIKTNRFGFVKKAMHGTSLLDFESLRRTYSRTIIDLAEPRWVFLNTLFSLSEGCIYAQLVELLDQRKIPEVLGYADLYNKVKKELEAAHMEGRLKADIIADPDRFVILDPEVVLTLLDQYYAGKRLLLITNSEWFYTEKMMSYAIDRFLPDGMTWRDLFEITIVGARKPTFFKTSSPFFEIVTPDGLLRPLCGHLQKSAAYLGGSAGELEAFLGLSGDEILYVGDHMFGDVRVTKNVLRWRTALILRELEQELKAVEDFHPIEEEIIRLMKEKEHLEMQTRQIRIIQQRNQHHYTHPNNTHPNTHPTASKKPIYPVDQIEMQIPLLKNEETLRVKLREIDSRIAPLAQKTQELNNPIWGLLLRAGNDKSHLAFQVERYADVYTSRVSNMLFATPFAYLRSPRGSLPHDRS